MEPVDASSVDNPLLYADTNNFCMPKAPNYFFDAEVLKWKGTAVSIPSGNVHGTCNGGTSIEVIIDYSRNISSKHPRVAIECLELAQDIISSGDTQNNKQLSERRSDETLSSISKLLASVKRRYFRLYET